MRILITGATGFIGSQLCRVLQAHHQLVACVRDPRALKLRLPGIKAVAVDFSKTRAVDDWLPLLQNIDAVINTVGIISERRQQTFEQLHHRAPCTLFRACSAAGVGKIIQISALGADEAALSRYHRSKKAADDCLKQLDLDWVIVQPSLIYGNGGNSASFFKALSALPLIPVIENGRQLIQPIHIDDLGNAVYKLLSSDAPVRFSLHAVGPQAISFKTMLLGYRRWLGITSQRVLRVPYSLSLLGGKLGELVGTVPLTSESIQMLRRGNTGDVAALSALLGSPPRTFDAALLQQPAEQADRWHARLFFLRPLLRITIGLLWLFTGVVSLGLYPVEQSYDLLERVGVTGVAAPLALYAAALLDIALGIATLARWRIQWVGLAQICLMLGYTLLISLGLSELWLHPFGPISKNIPLVVATLMMMALEKN